MCGIRNRNVILGHDEAACGPRVGIISSRCQQSGGAGVKLCRDVRMRLLDQELAQ